MKNFSVNDRVAFNYIGSGGKKMKGTVEETEYSFIAFGVEIIGLKILGDDGAFYVCPADNKSLKRLVKKKHLTVWINEYWDFGKLGCFKAYPSAELAAKEARERTSKCIRTIKFRECK